MRDRFTVALAQTKPHVWVGHADEAELGFSHPEVDRLLYAMIDLRYGRDELIGAGFAPSFADAVSSEVQRSQLKRRLPVIAELSLRTIDRDLRYARDWDLWA